MAPSKQNQQSENLFPKSLNVLYLNNLFLLGLIACILSILLVISASAKELRINLTESLDMNGNDKKPKDLAQKAKLQEKAKPDKAKQIKPEKPKPIVKAKPTTSTKTKHDTVKNSVKTLGDKKHNPPTPK